MPHRSSSPPSAECSTDRAGVVDVVVRDADPEDLLDGAVDVLVVEDLTSST
ncbi:hypothetical protein SMC26_39135 [Actinomadura fulvescens]|uniref:hypothetical protein n=1 Tax=Actinomadura fulvescens TaxID=46160 RepID=UPI00397B0C41